jgi:hypothetical protein
MRTVVIDHVKKTPTENYLLARVFAFLFALLYVVVLACLVGNCAAARAHGTADERTLPAAHQTAHDCAADRRSADNLRAGVMLMIAGPLGSDGPPMTALSSGFLARGS